MTAFWCSLLARNRGWSISAAKLTASVAASNMSSSKASSRHKQRRRFLQDATATNIVATLFDGLSLHQVYRSPQHLLQRFLEIDKAGEPGIGAGFEFDQQIRIAALRVEVLLTRGGAEDFQTPDVEPAAEFGKFLAFSADIGVHGWVRS
jgi:hypothetical protein